MSEVASRRTSIIGAALFSLVIACLLMPVGLIVWSAIADPGTGGPNPPSPVIPSGPSDRVAATAAEFRVDESGAATYSIPIYGVPGTAGVMPKLSLAYSSQGGSGPIGKGWSISGLSSIARCRATREAGDFIGAATPDGNPAPINYTDTDRYCLDGQRLIPAPSGSAACPLVGGMQAPQNLRTEIESFQRVCAYTPTANTTGVAFFTVERKDGSTSWYGDRVVNDTQNLGYNGYVNSTTPGKEVFARAWSQTRFQDSTGNYIDFVYTGPSAGEHLIAEVRYTGKRLLTGQAGSARDPYAKVQFVYSARPSAEWSNGYMSGGLLTQKWQLDAVISCVTIASTCHTDPMVQARHYKLTYAAAISGSGLKLLASLQECRDGSLGAVCLPATNFDWSTAKHEFATSQAWGVSYFGDTSRFEGFKFGDLDGDGRPDMVWLRDGSSGSACQTEFINVAYGEFDSSGRQSFQPASQANTCTPTELMPALGAASWQLFDYNGDSRDDLFIARGSNGNGHWAIYPSVGRPTGGQAFDMSNNLIANLSPAIPAVGNARFGNHPHLTDLNGDGLIDVVYSRSNPWGMHARIMKRVTGGYAWGAELSVQLNVPSACPVANCTLSGIYGGEGNFQLYDFNGDSGSDILYAFGSENDVSVPRERCGEDFTGSCRSVDTHRRLHALRVSAITSSSVSFTGYLSWDDVDHQYYIDHLDGNVPPPMPRMEYVKKPSFSDFNADGLTDTLIFDGSQWKLFFNKGNGQQAELILGANLSGSSEGDDYYDDLAKITDVNGDSRSDVLIPKIGSGSKQFHVRYGLPTNGLSAIAPLPGGNARACGGSGCNPRSKVHMFLDMDADGAVDYFALKLDSNPDFDLSQSASKFVPRDAITKITNGLGAVTQLKYASLTNAALYRRQSGARDAFNWGRGSPVFDFLAPIYVVASAASSSPQQGNPDALATLHYRYAGAKVQAGGRGFLGFDEIVTFDPNHSSGHIVTNTVYAQNFPFAGMPTRTTKLAVTAAYAIPVCLAGTINNSCYATPGQNFLALQGSSFSANAQQWEADADSSGAAFVEFAPNVQAPMHVRTAGTEETLRDPFAGGTTSRVVTAFAYGAYGNVTQTAVDTYTEGTALTASVTTNNSYAQDDPSKWRLGRLTNSTVTHRRPGQADIVRTTAFKYSMTGAATGLLTEERTQPGATPYMDLRKLHTLDDSGNRILSIVCTPTTANGCDIEGFDFNQTSSNTGVHRYSRTVYDSLQRYPVRIVEPFWNGNGHTEKSTQTVVSRNIFGDVTHMYDVNGVDTLATTGSLGRAYYHWVETVPGSAPGAADGGVTTIVSYNWCGTGTGQVSCPSGAKFRQTTMTTGAPTQWSYFDVLGRPVMQAKQTFNIGVTGKDVSAACTAYNASGKSNQTSNPFFLAGTSGNGPTGLEGVCASADRKWTVTTYDLLGRTTSVAAPDPAGTAVTAYAYHNLITGTRDPRNNLTNTFRNGKGEMTHVVDTAGLGLFYSYDAAGNLTEVRRNGGRGEIVNSYRYDALGRKIYQSDPDAGEATFTYNALGEILEQILADNHIRSVFDARGRVRRKNVYREHDRLENDILESTTTWTYDTAANGAGQLASENVMGYYGSDTGPAIDFSRSYTYDLLGRSISVTTTIDGEDFHTATQYDVFGRPFKSLDASGQWSKVEYQSRGAVALCFSSATDMVFDCGANAWQRTLETDAWGNVTQETRSASGNLTLRREADPLTGRITRLCADKPGGADCQLVNEQYAWDKAGNLHSHQKEGRYLEGFAYDNLNRLTTGTILVRNGITDNTVSQAFVYDRLGNVCRKQTFGVVKDYTYTGRAGCGIDGLPGSGGSGLAGPTQVYQAGGVAHYYDPRGNLTVSDAAGTANDRTVSYGAEGHAWQATQGGKRTRFWYGPDGARYKAEHQDLNETVYYIGNVEVVRQGAASSYRRNVGGFLVQRVVNGLNTNHFLWHDHLGSLVRMTDALGNVSTSSDFAAFGERRNPANPDQVGVEPSADVTRRGFTGHEHFGRLNLIHMNGRIYDPGIGRFMQVDPLIQAPGNAQSWNAYSYVINNPLKYVDPSGYFWVALLGTVATDLVGITVTASVITASQIAIVAAAVTTTAYVALAQGGVTGLQGVSGAYSPNASRPASGQSGSAQTGGITAQQAETLQGDLVQVVSPVRSYPGGVEFEYINTSGELVLYQEVYTASGPAFNTYVIGGATSQTTSLAGLQTALDVAGFIPGIGIGADLLNAGIHVYQGNYGLAALSAVGAVPIVGDAVAAGAKGAKFIGKGLHKNSLDYVGDTHVYRIKGPDGSTYKIGESAQGTRVSDGASIRGEQQARRLTRETGEFYQSEIRRTFPDKLSARKYEARVIERFRRRYGDDALPGNKTNR